LWKAWSHKQVFVTAFEDRAITNGPAITFSSLIPDLNHYHGRGGRVYPLWANAQATQPNVRKEILQTLAKALGAPVTPEDLLAYRFGHGASVLYRPV
jgi:Type ISP C-terminal specificity domain